MSELMTPAPVLAQPPLHAPTGNLLIHLETHPHFPAITRMGVVSLALDGLLDLVADKPDQKPLLQVEGEGWRFSRLAHWIPCWENDQLRVTVLAPYGERGVVVRLEPKRAGPIRVGGEVAKLGLRRFKEEGIKAQFHANHDPWSRSYVMLARTERTLLALGLQADNPPTRLQWDSRYSLEWDEHNQPITLYIALAPENDGARTTALHLRRVGYERLLQRTLTKLQSLWHGYQGPWSEGYQRHMALAYFYAQAETLEGHAALLTSRSPHYYVSGAYWSRDALLWFFPALLQADRPRAREVLRQAFWRYARWPGEHAQYLSGPPLYPGFELDQAAAYPLALARYLEGGPDPELLQELQEPLRWVFERVQQEQHPHLALYQTFLSPTDDPVPQPYLFYDNALWAVALERLAPFWPQRLHLQQQAGAVRQALMQHGVREGRMAFCFEPGGAHTFSDEPAGSLLLLPHLGFCPPTNLHWQATAQWILGPNNPYHFGGPLGGEGSAHFPFPSGFALANRLLLGGEYRQQALQVYSQAALDGGYACESYDPQSGVGRTGVGFAALAGFTAHALYQSWLA